MNFFGHAAVASWHSSDPTFALGAMLPDFAGMLGDRVPQSGEGSLFEGIAFHHDTDRVFHGSRTFVELERSARSVLASWEVRRGTALAVAHVGVELLLDAELARDRRYRDAYVAALSAGVSPGKPNLDFRYRSLCRMLRWRGVMQAPLAPNQVTRRLCRALDHRPRLRVPADQASRITRWVEETAPSIATALPELLKELQQGLGIGQSASGP